MATKGANPEDAAWMLDDCIHAARPTEFDDDWIRLLMGHYAVATLACEFMGSGAEGVQLC